MKQNINPRMPPEYEHLEAPLSRTQEHIFLIDAELEKLEKRGNPLNEYAIVKLQDERSNIIRNLKNDFELHTFEEGPAKTEEVYAIVDKRLSHEAYQAGKEDLTASGKTYETSKYWQDRFELNLAAWHEHYSTHQNIDAMRNSANHDRSGEFDDPERC